MPSDWCENIKWLLLYSHNQNLFWPDTYFSDGVLLFCSGFRYLASNHFDCVTNYLAEEIICVSFVFFVLGNCVIIWKKKWSIPLWAMEPLSPLDPLGAGAKGSCELSDMGIGLNCLLEEQQVLLTAVSTYSLFVSFMICPLILGSLLFSEGKHRRVGLVERRGEKGRNWGE